MYKYCVSAFPLVCNLFRELFGEEYKANIKQRKYLQYCTRQNDICLLSHAYSHFTSLGSTSTGVWPEKDSPFIDLKKFNQQLLVLDQSPLQQGKGE